MRNRRKGSSRKRKTDSYDTYTEEDVPRSFIVHNGEISSNLKRLIVNFKNVMKPHTAHRLVAKRRNSLKDFVTMASSYKVTHIIIFSQTEKAVYMKIGRLPQGPTLTFKVENYSLMSDISQMKLKQMIDSKMWEYAPCLMTNLQPSEGEKQFQLCSQMFLDMFPTIAPSTIKTKEIKRCCLIHYDEEEDCFDFRHYSIRVKPVGLSKATKELIGNKIPDLGNYKEAADFVTKSEVLSESEVEEDPSNYISVPDNINKDMKNNSNPQSYVRLFEIGPRLNLQLLKVEGNLCGGDVLFHKFNSQFNTAEDL